MTSLGEWFEERRTEGLGTGLSLFLVAAGAFGLGALGLKMFTGGGDRGSALVGKNVAALTLPDAPLPQQSAPPPLSSKPPPPHTPSSPTWIIPRRMSRGSSGTSTLSLRCPIWWPRASSSLAIRTRTTCA